MRKLCYLVFLLSFVSALAVAAEQPHFNCAPAFSLKAPWEGADAAYSIPLKDGRVVWIFGDTLYGPDRTVKGQEPEMTHNSIGISTCKDGQWSLTYSIKRDAKGAFDSFFKPAGDDPSLYYWALDGVEYKGELWVTLLRVKNKPNSDAFALGFEVVGTDLAHVTNIKSDPQNWNITIAPLVPEGVFANPSASTLIEGEYLYIYTNYEKDARPQILVRIPLKGLNDAKKNLQYFGKDDQWHDGIEPTKAKAVMAKGASEMSVRWHPELKEWVAVMVDPQIFSDKVIFSTSPSMTGPFTEGEVIYKIPELQKATFAHFDADTFCYAGKEHPEFEKPGQLLFTYVCNTMKPKKLETEPWVYLPQVVTMPMPDSAKK